MKTYKSPLTQNFSSLRFLFLFFPPNLTLWTTKAEGKQQKKREMNKWTVISITDKAHQAAIFMVLFVPIDLFVVKVTKADKLKGA